MMNFQDQMTDRIQTNAPSIRYEGDLRPEQAGIMQQQAQAMQQMQQQAMMQQQQPQQPMMQQPQGRMPAGRMPAMAMGGITGLNMPGYNGGGTVGSMRDSLKSKGYDWIDDADDDTVRQIFNSEEGTFSIPSRSSKAYGGVMGQDGRKQYGIGSWFQKKIMDPIKNNPVTTALVGGALLNQYGLPDFVTEKVGLGSDVGQNFLGKILGGITPGDTEFNTVFGDDTPFTTQGKTPFSFKDTAKSLIKDNPDGKKSFLGLSPGMLSAIGGGVAGLFADKIDTPENIEPDYGTGIGIRNVGQAANILDPKQGMAAGLRFLPELSTRKYSPAEMLTQYGAVNEPLATANLAEGGAAFQRSSTDVSTALQMLVKRLQEINAAMIGAEMEEVVPMMQEALQIKDKIQEISSSAPQDIGMEVEGIKDMVRRTSSSTPSADEIDIVSAGEMLDNTNTGIRTSRDDTVNQEIINNLISQGTGNNKSVMMSGKMTGENPFANVNIPSIRMEGDAGSDMGEFSMENFAEGGPSGGIGSMMEEQSEMLDLGGMEKDYREEGGFVPIGEYEKKDDVPARLSVNEFVFTADAVRGAGDGDIDKGAERLQGIMKQLEQQGKPEGMEMMEVSERLSEVV
jgi:hypothetical protein